MKKITLDYSKALDFVANCEMELFQERISQCHKMLCQGRGPGSDFLGWMNLPQNFDVKEYDMLKEIAEKVKEQSDAFIVIGIGGSYLGAKAAFEMLNHTFYNELPKDKRKGPRVYFAGNNISSTYLAHLLEVIDDGEVSLNVISKSGTTTEPAIAFRILKEYMENKYGKEKAAERIYVTTDKSRGALKALAQQEGYQTFVIPEDVGGRYSVLTPVGLFPMAVAGIDTDGVLEGARRGAEDLLTDSLEENHAYQYAALRNLLYLKGKVIEILASYEPNLAYFGEWYKQLFGESEGKDGKGIFPTSLNFTTDLHSMGQYIQEGRKHIFETVLNVEKPKRELVIKEDERNVDGLNYLSGKTMDFVNKKAMEGTILAHVNGQVPNLVINIPEISPYYFGYLVYFFEKACAMSGYLLGINPFNQPGVEAYKTNMFRLLGKPGYK